MEGLSKSDIKDIQSTVEFLILPKGTRLYRAQSKEYDFKSSDDPDTGKKGIYLSDTAHIPVGMILEYNKSLNIGIYKTNKPLKLYIGKYSFRNLEPELYFKNLSDWRNGIFRFNVNPKKKEYWNHYDNALYPIHDMFSSENIDTWEKIDMAEIFITDEKDIDLIKLVKSVTVHDATMMLTKEFNKIKKKH